MATGASLPPPGNAISLEAGVRILDNLPRILVFVRHLAQRGGEKTHFAVQESWNIEHRRCSSIISLFKQRDGGEGGGGGSRPPRCLVAVARVCKSEKAYTAKTIPRVTSSPQL